MLLEDLEATLGVAALVEAASLWIGTHDAAVAQKDCHALPVPGLEAVDLEKVAVADVKAVEGDALAEGDVADELGLGVERVEFAPAERDSRGMVQKRSEPLYVAIDCHAAMRDSRGDASMRADQSQGRGCRRTGCRSTA